jgi:hypothetical protein
MVDGVRAKRALLTAALLVVAATCLLVVLVPRFWPVVAAGVVGALAGHTIAITVAAISLGIVGPARFAHRAARNEALFHTGNICVNLAILITAPLFGIAYPSAEGNRSHPPCRQAASFTGMLGRDEPFRAAAIRSRA